MSSSWQTRIVYAKGGSAGWSTHFRLSITVRGVKSILGRETAKIRPSLSVNTAGPGTIGSGVTRPMTSSAGMRGGKSRSILSSNPPSAIPTFGANLA